MIKLKHLLLMIVCGLFQIAILQAQTTVIYEQISGTSLSGKASSSLPEFPVNATINGKGISKGLHKSDNLGRNMWISELSTELTQAHPVTKKGVVWLEYSFDKPVTVDRINIWNHNQHNHLNRGLQKIYIQYSKDGIEWKTLRKNDNEFIMIPKSKGHHQSMPDLQLNTLGLQFKYLVITADKLQGNYYHDGNSRTQEEAKLNNQNINYYGLSEIRFYQKKLRKIKNLPEITGIRFNVTQGYRKSAEGPRREFMVEFEEPLYTGGIVNVSYNGKNNSSAIPASDKGIYHYALTFPPGIMEENQNVEFTFSSPQGNFLENRKIPGARKWEVHFLPHSHLDIGYTHSHEEVLERQLRNIDLAMELIKATKSYPAESRFKWNIETVWPLLSFKERYLGTKKWRDFKKAVQSGSIGLNAALGNILTGLNKQEELMHLFDDGIEIGNDLGVSVNSVMMSDVPGFSWGIVTSMAENGLRYFSMAPNYVPHLLTGGSRVGLSHVEWANRPFYWQSQSGQEEILCWSAGTGYSFFHDWLAGPLSSSGLSPVWNELEKLESERFPYNITYFRYTVNGDNGPPDHNMSALIKKWNESYTSPKFVINTTDSLFSEFEKRYGEHVPRFKGDLSPYWEDGASSTAATLAMNRENSENLNQLEILWSMNGLQYFPFDMFKMAWRNIVLFSEHTWGASASGTHPESALTKMLWKQKERFALKADSLTKGISSNLKQKFLNNNTGEYIQVFNTHLTYRSGLVEINTSLDLSDSVLLDTEGSVIPVQEAKKDNWVFIVKNIPPLSSRAYRISKRKEDLYSDIIASPVKLNNGLIRIEIDPKSGAIAHLINSKGKDFAGKGGLNKYIYSDRNLGDIRVNDSVYNTSVIKGPVFTTLRVYSKPKGTQGLYQDITLYEGLNRIDLRNRIEKTKATGFENIRFGFPFAIENPETEIDISYSLMRPEREQLAGANKNFYTMNNGVAITGLKQSVLLATTDAPILEIGSMSGESWMEDRVEFLSWNRQATSSSTIYSWVMNNSWMTNYKRSQQGEAIFEYTIIPLEGDAEDTKMISHELARPLVGFVSGNNIGIESLFSLKGNHQIAVSTLRPATDGSGYILRLTNMSGKNIHTAFEWGQIKPTEVFECTNQEKFIQKINDQSFWLQGYGTKTLKLKI